MHFISIYTELYMYMECLYFRKMKLTRYTDYALRTLIFLAARDGGLVSIRQIAEAHDISQNHLMKIVQDLAASGFIRTTRGRHGGLQLARPATEITIGQVVRHTEGDSGMVDCSTCRVAEDCGLPAVFSEAREAFLAVLDRCRLSDVARMPNAFRHLFVV
ncbi:DNA-binding protein [Paracoccus acridae]|uniref:DNA-binding protein n=2 Tax=Paracoccus acridae TaxID=1795310 RepID=A0ABQ1VM23_9RHOB|nr:DNA-binding protein [Paracoccus acridae]